MMNHHYRQWQRFAPLGLGMIGCGLSVIGEATIAKGRGDSALRWVTLGTVGLCLCNAGVSIFGEAIKQRALYEIGAER